MARMAEQKNFHLLLGAGFSRNWEGWLASEADEYLLGHPLVDGAIRELLWRHRKTGGFEAALGELQTKHQNSQTLQNFEAHRQEQGRHYLQGRRTCRGAMASS